MKSAQVVIVQAVNGFQARLGNKPFVFVTLDEVQKAVAGFLAGEFTEPSKDVPVEPAAR